MPALARVSGARPRSAALPGTHSSPLLPRTRLRAILATPDPGCSCLHWALSLQWAPELPEGGAQGPPSPGPHPDVRAARTAGRGGGPDPGRGLCARPPSMASGPAGSRRVGGAAQTSVLTLRLRAKASRMADRRLGLSACRPPKGGGSSRSSWPRPW